MKKAGLLWEPYLMGVTLRFPHTEMVRGNPRRAGLGVERHRGSVLELLRLSLCEVSH